MTNKHPKSPAYAHKKPGPKSKDRAPRSIKEWGERLERNTPNNPKPSKSDEAEFEEWWVKYAVRVGEVETMKLYVEKKEMTQAEAEAGQTKTKRLCTASQYFQISKEQWVKEVYPHLPVRIENGLLARNFVGYIYGDRRGVIAGQRPSCRFGVLYVIDEKSHNHIFKAQPKKCEFSATLKEEKKVI